MFVALVLMSSAWAKAPRYSPLMLRPSRFCLRFENNGSSTKLGKAQSPDKCHEI